MNNRGKKVGGCNSCAKARAARLAKIKAEQEKKTEVAKQKVNVVMPKETDTKSSKIKLKVINEEPCEYCDEIKE